MKGGTLCLTISYSAVITSLFGSLKNNKNLVTEILAFLLFSNATILGGQFLNIWETGFSKLMFYLLLSYKFSDVHFPNFYLHLKHLLNYCSQNCFNALLTKKECLLLLTDSSFLDVNIIELGFQKICSFLFQRKLFFQLLV